MKNSARLFRSPYSLFVLFALLLTSCATNYEGYSRRGRGARAPIEEENLTVAAAQKSIRVGMSGAEVAEVLGSPNVVSNDAQGRETWIYDRMSTVSSAQSSSAGAWLLIFGASSGRSARSTSQRTLTIIVYFDNDGLVRDLRYRQSSF